MVLGTRRSPATIGATAYGLSHPTQNLFVEFPAADASRRARSASGAVNKAISNLGVSYLSNRRARRWPADRIEHDPPVSCLLCRVCASWNKQHSGAALLRPGLPPAALLGAYTVTAC